VLLWVYYAFAFLPHDCDGRYMILYVAARVSIVEDCYTNLAYLPDSVLQTGMWANVPHFGVGR
jgi:hypothetical protein